MIPPSKRSQSLIVFGRVQPRMFAVTDSGSDSEPTNFPLFTINAPYDEKNGYNLQCGSDLNFGRGRHGLLRTFTPKGKPTNYYDKICRGLGYVTPPLSFSPKETNLCRHIPLVHLSENQMSVWGCSSKISSSI